MENTQNNIKTTDSVFIDISTMSIDTFKSIKLQLNFNFDNQISELQGKLPHNYAAILLHTHGFNAKEVRDVKNGRKRSTKILNALKELVKTSSQNAQTLIQDLTTTDNE